jgi:hypothetical protein
MAMALRHENVMEQLTGALTSDLVLANSFFYGIAEHAAAFVIRFGHLPGHGDWDVWLNTLPEGTLRDGSRETLGRLQATDVSGYQPEYFAEKALPQIKLAAARVVRARLNELGDGVTPETITAMAAKLDAITASPASRRNLFPTLGEVLRGVDGDVEDDAEELITGLAWRGRHVMLAAREKLGKSTFVAAGAVAFSWGQRFLYPGDDQGHVSAPMGRVLWLAMDEAHSEAFSRLVENGALRTNISVQNPDNPAAFLSTALRDEKQRPDVVVIDSLFEYARRTTGEMPGSGDAAAWGPVVRPLSAWAHDHQVAIITIHHAGKATGEFRDSTEIGAAPDAILTMKQPAREPDDTPVRIIEVKARRSIRCTTYVVQLVQEEVQVPLPTGPTTVRHDRYVWATAAPAPVPPSIREQIQTFVAANPDSTQQAVLAAVSGDRNTAHSELKAMVQEGVVQEKKGRRGALTYSPTTTP